MDSSKDADAAVGILHPLSTLTWIDYEEVPKLYDKTQTVYIIQQSTLYTSIRTGGDVGDLLYFCNWPFRGQKVARWKGPHKSIREKNLKKYALAAYGSNLAIVGGWNQISRCSTDQVWILHKASSQPKLLSSPMLTKRHSGVAVGTDNYLAVTGGRNEDKDLHMDVEVYNGTQWNKVKSLPKELRNLTSVVHDGVWYLVEEVDQNEGGATYSASLEGLVTSQDAKWKMLDQCSSGEMLMGPVSFDGQLLIIKWRWSSGYGIHMLSPKTKSWVHIAPVPLTQESHSADRNRHASMVNLPEGRLMVMATDSISRTCIKIADVKGADFNNDEKFSLMSLTRLEHGYNIPVLASLGANHLWKLKDKAVFDLKFNEGSKYEPAVNIYINSWLEDADAGCPPSWNHLLVLLSEVGLQDIAKQILEILTLNSQASLCDISIANGTGVETLLNLQSQLDSLSISVHEESAQDLSEQIQRNCHIVVWEQRKLKRELEKVKVQQSIHLSKRIKDERMREMLKQSYSGAMSIPQISGPPPKIRHTSQQAIQAGDNQDQEPELGEPKRFHDRPKLHELDLIEDKCRKVELIKELAAEWEKIAIRLYFESHHIRRIQRDNPHSSEDCCRAVFMDWLEGTGRQPITWKVVVDAISEAGFTRVAKDLKSVLCI